MAINPLQQPINYAVDVQSPFAAAFEGMKFRAGQEELEAMRNKRQLEAQQMQAAQAQQQQFQSRVNSFFAKPPTERKYAELEPLLVGANKQQFDALKQIGENMSAEQLSNAKKFTGQVLLSFEANPENAKTMLRERLAVEPDPNQKRAFEDILTIAETDPKEAARLVEENGAAAFGKTWYEGLESARKGRREAALAPGALIEANAKADKAVSDAIVAKETATNAPETAKADAALKVAQADKARVDAIFAEQKAQADLDKTRAEIRETDADILIAKEDNRIKALNAAAAKELNAVKRDEILQKREEATGKRDQAKRDQDLLLDSQLSSIDNFLNTAIRATKTPLSVREAATGPIASRFLPTIRQETADYESLIETLGAQAFLAQIPQMKSLGALSEKEGDKLQASLQNLSLRQSPARLQENIDEAVRLMTKGREYIARRSGKEVAPPDTPAAPQTVQTPDGPVTLPNKAAADAFRQKYRLK